MPQEAIPGTPPVGVILAGGAGVRFGGLKGLERVAGERIIDRVASALQTVTPELLLVANDPTADAWLPSVPRIVDRIADGGGLSGLHAALIHTQRRVLIVAWDMPFVAPALLRELWVRCAQARAIAAVPISVSPVGMEPFCACYAPECLAPLERALNNHQTGAARFVRVLSRVAWLTEADVNAFGDPARMFLSVNTQDDLARAEAMASRAR